MRALRGFRRASRASQKQTCPRRMAEWGSWKREEGLDSWGPHGCSFCGSLHPDRFMELVEAGAEVGPTDKSYKAYLRHSEIKGGSGIIPNGEAKFYYQHLSSEQRVRFVELINEHRMVIGYPGHFYQLPFFVSVGSHEQEG